MSSNHELIPLEFIRELGNIKQLRTIPLMGIHVVPQVEPQESIDSLSLVITLRVETSKVNELRTHEFEQIYTKILYQLRNEESSDTSRRT